MRGHIVLKYLIGHNFSQFFPEGDPLDVASGLELFHDQIVRLHNPVNRGLPASLNRGIAAARGRYLVRVDSDDYVNANFDDYVAIGIGKTPMAFIYENQLVSYALAKKGVGADMVLLYPLPTIVNKVVYISLNERAKALGELAKARPRQLETFQGRQLHCTLLTR